MRALPLILVLSLYGGLAWAQVNACGTARDCACQTGQRSLVILPSDVETDLQEGDLITARYGALCVGQQTYVSGQAVSISIWGDNLLTSAIDGVPEDRRITFSIDRPASGQVVDEALVQYLSRSGALIREGLFEDGTIMILAALSTQPNINAIQFDGFSVAMAPLGVRDGGAHAQLQWATITETNNAGFEVQHQYLQHGDSTWNALGFIQGHGSTTETQNYRFQSQTLPSGRHRFRLKQLDHDGRFQYSDEVELEIELPEDYQLSSAYPNPFNPQTQMTLRLRQGEPVQAQAFDVQGRMVRRLYQGTVPANETVSLQFEAGDLPSGLYLIRVQGASFVETRTVMLIK